MREVMKSPIPDQRDANADDGSMELSLEDTLAQRMRGGRVKPGKTAGGYNPYDTVPLDKSKGKSKRAKPTDLRKLSEWIRITREIEQLKKEQS